MRFINNSFKQAWILLKKNKALAIPFLTASLIWYVIFAGILFSTGAQPLYKEYLELQEDYAELEEQRHREEMGNTIFGSIAANMIGVDEEGFQEHLEEQGWDGSKWEHIYTMRTVYIGLAWLLLGLIIAIYANTWGYMKIVASMKKIKDPGRQALNKMPRFVGLSILSGLITIAPFILIGILGVIGAIYKNAFILIPIGILFLPALAYVFFFSIKLFYAKPALFLDNKGPVESLKFSWNKTRTKFWKTFLAALVCFGLGYAIVLFLRDPLGFAAWKTIMGSIGYFVLFAILICIQAGIQTLQAGYLLKVYKEAK